MLESDGRISEQGLADIALEICSRAQHKSGLQSGKIDILNVTRGGVIPSGD
jgi:hypothetical protein